MATKSTTEASNSCILSRIWANPKGKTAMITLVILAVAAAAIALGLNYGVGFDKVHDWFKGLNAGEWIGVGTGGATALLLVGGGYLVYRGCTRKPKAELDLTKSDTEPFDSK